MYLKRLVLGIIALLWILLPLAVAQDTLYVASDDAKLKADKSASSETLAVVPVGTEVKVLESGDRWHKIGLPSGEQGWMYRGKLSDTAPAKETEAGGVGTLLASAPGGRIQADEATTARSIRGLSNETEEYAKLRKTPEAYRKALDEVLARKIGEKDLQAFLKAGKIGEYAP